LTEQEINSAIAEDAATQNPADESVSSMFGSDSQNPQDASETQAEGTPPAEIEITPEIQALIDAKAAAQTEEKSKAFQAQWTQKNQELSAKAKLADQILSNPQMLAAIQALQGGQPGIRPSEPQKPQAFYEESGFEEFDAKSQLQIKEGAMRAVAEKLFPVLEPALRELREVKAQLAELQYERAAAGNPEAGNAKAEVISFFQQNPNFMADKTPQERIQLALRVLSPTQANQQTETSPPAKAAAPARNGTPANGNTLAAALASQTVRSGVPSPGPRQITYKGASLDGLVNQLAKQQGRNREQVAKETLEYLFGQG